MPTTSPFRVRFALVGIFSVLTIGFALSPGSAQPGKGPGMGGPKGPGMGGPKGPGMGGMPGGAGGMPGGGISGMPGKGPGAGIGGIGGAGIGGMPGPGMPGGISGIGGAGIGGMPGPGGIAGGGIGGGGGIPTYSLSCGKCGVSLGTTTNPLTGGPSRCPACGVNFVGTNMVGGGGPAGPGGGFGVVPSAPIPPAGMPGGSAPPAAPPGGTVTPSLPINTATGETFTPSPPPSAPPAESSTPSTSSSSDNSSSSDSSSSGGRSKTFKLIGIVCGGILLIGAIAALVVVVSNANAVKPTKRPKKKRVYELDD